MKPDEDMHAAVEEVDLDPCDLYTDLGTLIVEGRVPGLTDKGFGEGPHCPKQNRHQCDPSSPECQKYDQILKHMLLLWKNGIPMTIEVLLYPNCCSPSQNVESVPDMAYVLLEQWTIHMLPRRVPDASIHPRGLIQAVRSFLYFSQLCAWYSLTGGKSPKNIHYRVCVPGEAFSSKFSSQPDSHVFPVANVGRNSAMKVQIKYHPRCGEIPLVPCHKHSSQLKTRKCEKQVKCRPRDIYDGVRTTSPGDSMLGESLLDPPNDLCMYPKRYQSPSRCGSPSIEVPEHLMFGAVKEPSSPRRSRPQRRPVVERFLKSGFNPEIESRTYNKRVAAIKTPETVLSYCCIEDVPQEELEEVLKTLRQRDCKKNDGFSHLIDDMTIGSNLLEQQNKELKKGRQLFYNKNNQPCDGLSHLMGEMNIRSNLLEQQQNKELKKNSHLFYVNKQSESCDSKSLFKQALRLNKESSNRKYECTKNLPPSTYEKFSEVHRSHTSDPQIKDLTSSSKHSLSNRLNKLGCYKYEYTKNYDKLSLPVVHKNCTNNPQTKDPPSADPILSSRLQSPSYCVQSKRDRWLKQNIDTQNILPEQNPCLKETYLHDEPDRTLLSSTHLRLGSVNIKKYGALLSKGDTNELINDERAILDSVFPSTDDLDEISPISYIIPSAEKKALFRQSLDSATSLVFHQRSGLPLTSSPAPVRKSGTCFDFDSSLTTVSAIKRALFEKEVEEKFEEEDTVNLSNSAPASIVSSSLLGTFEESVLNGRLEPVSTVEGFTAEIGASGSFCPRHITLPVTVFFYTLQDMDKVTSPYMGHINLRDKDYHIPKKGTVQVTLFNPHGTVVKMFVVRYDLSDMPVNCQTFLRQRTLYMPQDASENDPHAQKWLRYLIHLRFMSSKSGRIYLHTDVRVIIFRKSDLDAATVHGQRPYELRSFTHGPLNPKFSTHKPPLPCT